jgi:hypothetical protein
MRVGESEYLRDFASGSLMSLAEKHTIYTMLLKSAAKRFGVCLIRDDEIISACKVVCVGGGEVEIDAHTEEKHREGKDTLS